MASTMRVTTAFCTNPLFINTKNKCIHSDGHSVFKIENNIRELFMCILLVSESHTI
jgi:hypothetical protein